MDKAHVGRRKFFRRVLGLGGSLMLAGCDRLSHSEGFVRVLSSAEVLNNKLHHLITPRKSMAKEFTEADLSATFRSNGTSYPIGKHYAELVASNFAAWRLEVGGLVARPANFSLAELQTMPARTQITRHDCVEGWSAIGKWKGVPLGEVLQRVQPLAKARYAMFYCADAMGEGKVYYESIDMEDAFHPQTILAYELNDASLPVPNGAPLRLRVERQLGYKMAKYIVRIELVESFENINGGKGGYWEDTGYEWYAGI